MLNIDRSKIEVAYRTHWWGSDCTCEPAFVEKALGDGNVLLGLQPLSTRPNYYVIRVDSSWHLYYCYECEGKCPDELVEHIDEIYDAIEDEYGEKDRIRYFNENDLEEGEEPDSEDWPVLDLDCGASWFTIDPTEYLVTTPESEASTASTPHQNPKSDTLVECPKADKCDLICSNCHRLHHGEPF